MTHRTIVLFVAFICFINDVSAERQTSLPVHIHVTDYGDVRRQRFPVTGGIPLPKGALAEEELRYLALLSGDNTQVPVQFTVIGRWSDRAYCGRSSYEVKWEMSGYAGEATQKNHSFHWI
jgi:hypothetical protein